MVSKLKKVVPSIGSRFVKHTSRAKKAYLGLVKGTKGRTDRDKAALKNSQEKLVKIAEETIVGG